MPLAYPLVNGNRFDFSSVAIFVGPQRFEGIKSINYSDTLTPGELRGNRAQVTGRTRGKYAPEASIELYKSEGDALLLALGGPPPGLGYMEQTFDIQVQYSELATPDLLVIDSIRGCRIKKAEDQGSEGEEPLTLKLDLSVLLILRNGRSPLAPTALLGL